MTELQLTPVQTAILSLEPPLPFRVTGEEILTIVCEMMRVNRREFLSQRRTPHMVRARFIGYRVALEKTTMTVPEIGRVFNRDHSTVSYGIKRVEANRAAYEPELSAVLNRVQALLERKQVRA